MDVKQKFREEKNMDVYAKDVTDGSFSNIYVKWLEQQLLLHNVSQQRELFNAILDFSEDLPLCTEDYHRSELWEKYKALNCG